MNCWTTTNDCPPSKLEHATWVVAEMGRIEEPTRAGHIQLCIAGKLYDDNNMSDRLSAHYSKTYYCSNGTEKFQKNYVIKQNRESSWSNKVET